MVEAQEQRELDERTAGSLVRLALFNEQGDDESEDEEDSIPPTKNNGIESTLAHSSARTHEQRPTAFHLLLASFVVLLHRYTGDTDIIVATSSPSSPSPLLLRIRLDPADSFWSLVKRVQWVEQEAEEDKIDYDSLLQALGKDDTEEMAASKAPLFRVRFIDETDQTEQAFLQSTDLTTDLTVLVSSSSSAPASVAQSGTSTPTSLRTSLIAGPAISLTLAYNSLVFSRPRMSYTLDQLLHLVYYASVHPLDSIGSISLLTVKQRKLLPDPKKDLEWTGYRGAITDIFSANAQKFPERICIVESVAPEDSPVGGKNLLREFTYKQIDEASNVLAHELVKGGVQREEVVTVYSTRGVDLVIAVMGVLKAGATFSVIGEFSLRKVVSWS